MIYEHRHYTMKPGMMDVCHRVFQETLIPLFNKLGVKMVAFWEPQDGDGTDFIYMLAFEYAAAKDKAWAAFVEDPSWKKLGVDLGDNAPWAGSKSTILVPTSYSPPP